MSSLNNSNNVNNEKPQENQTNGATGELNASFLRAARAGNLDKVLEYLNQNIDINVSNSNGLNALHLASKEGHVHVVKELLEKNANVNAATKKGNTALHIASLAGQLDVVKLLAQFGANVDCRSQNGFTPLYMAAQENHIEVVKFLLENNANQTLATEDGFTPLAVALQQGHEKVVAILLENDSRGKIRLPALHIAAKKNDVKAANLLLTNDPNMDLSPESGFTPLHIAAHYGNAEIAKFLITKGADVNFEARQNITPLHVATKWGKVNSVNLLLDNGAKIDVKTRDGLTPLHCAARSGHDQVVELLISRNAPINAKTKNGLTALHMAAQGDHVEAARILLYHSPKLVDQTTCDFLTALHVAAHCGHVKIAKLLLDHKADVNSRALNGFTPLHIACKKNRIKVIELLIKHGASKEATTESGLTPLHVASFMGCINVVVFLIQHGAQPNVPTIRGETPLHLAARATQTDIVRILLRHGASVNAEAKEKQTPLHIATRIGNTDIIGLLLRHGASVDAATSDGYTALHIASKEGQEEVASILFENGASLNVTTKKGFTPLHIAAKYGNIKVASLLLQRKAQPDMQGKNGLTPLHVATHYNRPSVAHLLLQHGASPHIVAKNGYSALHIAAKKNQMDIATTLLEYNAKTNCESNAGFTPLHLACQEGHIDMASLLLDHHADANSASKNGLTPLHLCAQEDKVNCAAILVKTGALIDPQTKAGYTPLHVACHFGQLNMVKFLLQHKADVNIITKHGFTSLHCAAQQGHVQIVKLLLENGASPDITNNNGQTPLAIAQRLGYISVIEELKLVTQTTLVSTTIKTTEEKYKVQTPETMQETFMSDSEDELGDEGMFNTADYTTYLTDEAHLHNVGDESIALTPKTPKKEEASKLESIAVEIQPHQDTHQADEEEAALQRSAASKHLHDITTISQQSQQQQQTPSQHLQLHPEQTTSSTGKKLTGGSVANMSMAESMDGSFYNGYESSKHVNMLETDNIPVEARPKSAGFLISFMVDARGGAMKGCRHSGVRVIIPPKRASMPTRITCRFVRKEKLSLAPPLNESEALAARVLEMGPQGYKFLGPVVLEIPHYASLRGKEREIIILRNDSGEKWYEHPLVATESAIEEALGCTLELAATVGTGANATGGGASGAEDAQSTHQNDDNLSTTSSKLRITRIITNDFPKYFALVSRVRHETHAVSETGGVISSTIVPKAQAVFPEKALQKKIKISLQAMPIPYELVAKMFGNRVAVSPIVTIEPRRRKFHKAITLTIPLPKSPHKGMINNYTHNNESFSLRLLCSITGGLAPAQWEDITGHTPLSYIEECVSFTTTVSARFWLMNCQQVTEATKMATELYREAIAVPFMARFIVYAKRHDLNEAKLRVYCITDDKEDKTLEVRESFQTVAKSKEVEVLENRIQWLEMGGNIVPVTNKSSGEQLSMLFSAFYENRLPFTVRIRDLDHTPPTGRLVFLKDAKNALVKSDLRSAPVCTLDIQLPSYDRDAIEHDEIRKKNTLERSGGLQFSFLNGSGTLSSGARSTNLLYTGSAQHLQQQPRQVEFNLRLLSNDLNNSERAFDWTQLAARLGLTGDEIDTIKHASLSSANIFQISAANQTYDMLTHWVNKFNNLDYNSPYSSGEVLLNALKDLNVDEEIINRNISSSYISSASQPQQQGSNAAAPPPANTQFDNIYSVEKSLAKLNLNLNELAKKEESPNQESTFRVKKTSLGNYDEPDMTKESESADDVSDNEQHKLIVSRDSYPEEEEDQYMKTTTIIAEEHVYNKPSGTVTETIIDSVVNSRDRENLENFNQHIEDRTELNYDDAQQQQSTLSTSHGTDDDQYHHHDNNEMHHHHHHQHHQPSKTDLEYNSIKSAILSSNNNRQKDESHEAATATMTTTTTMSGVGSGLSDPDYCSKINAEYEAIKRSILAKNATAGLIGGDYDNLANFKVDDSAVGQSPMGSSNLTAQKSAKNVDHLINSHLASILVPISHHLTSSYYDNLNEHSSLDNDQMNRLLMSVSSPSAAAAATGMPHVQLYDNLENIQTIDVDKAAVHEPVVYSMSELVVHDDDDHNGMTRSELDELIDKINDMQNASSARDDFTITTQADTTNSQMSSSSSINSLNKIDEYAKLVSEKYAPGPEPEPTSAPATQPNQEPAASMPDTSEILNDIIQQVMNAQEHIQRLEQDEQPAACDANFTWEKLMPQTILNVTEQTDVFETDNEKPDLTATLTTTASQLIVDDSQPDEEAPTYTTTSITNQAHEQPSEADETVVIIEEDSDDDDDDESGGEEDGMPAEAETEMMLMSATHAAKTRPSQLGDLDIDLDDMNSTNKVIMDAIEKQSPIIERELLTTEQQLENFRSRLAMSESVSAVTQSVLESIRKEYNLPDDDEQAEQRQQSDSEDDEQVDQFESKHEPILLPAESESEKEIAPEQPAVEEHSSSYDETSAGEYEDYKRSEEKAADDELLMSSGKEQDPSSSSNDEAVLEMLATKSVPADRELMSELKDANEELRQKCDEIIGKVKREKEVQHVIETFAKESQSQIEKIMMIQNLDEPDEVEVDEDDEENQVLAFVKPQKDHKSSSYSSTALDSDADTQDLHHMKRTHEKQDLHSAEVEEQPLSKSARKLSISQTRLIEGSESDSAAEQLDVEVTYHQAEQDVLSKSKQYQTFESSSSTNSDLNRQDDYPTTSRRQSQRNKSRDSSSPTAARHDEDDADDDDDNLGGGAVTVDVAVDLNRQSPSSQLPTEQAVSIMYSSGSSQSITDDIRPVESASSALVQPSQLLAVSTAGIKESESRELLLSDGHKLDDDEDEDELETSVHLETVEIIHGEEEEPTGRSQLEVYTRPSNLQLTPNNEGSIDDVSITTVIERRTSGDLSNQYQSSTQQSERQRPESSTEISSEADETDEEHKQTTIRTPVEEANLLSGSEPEETASAPTETDLKSNMYLNLPMGDESINQSESMEPLILQQQQQQADEAALMLDDAPATSMDFYSRDYTTDSPLYQNSSSSAASILSSTSEENMLMKTSLSTEAVHQQQQIQGSRESSLNENVPINEHAQVISKSLTYLESLVVPSSSNDIEQIEKSLHLFKKEYDDEKKGSEGKPLPTSSGENLLIDKDNQDEHKNSLSSLKSSQSLNLKNINKPVGVVGTAAAATRPASFTVKPSPGDVDAACDDLFGRGKQLEQEQQTPTPVDNMAGDFFDKRITSSNEPSTDRFTSSENIDKMTVEDEPTEETNAQAVHSDDDEGLTSFLSGNDDKETEEQAEEVAAAVATALLFSSTIKSQSSDEVKSVSCQNDGEAAALSSSNSNDMGSLGVDQDQDTNAISIQSANSFTKYIVLKKQDDQEEGGEESSASASAPGIESGSESGEQATVKETLLLQGIDNPCFEAGDVSVNSSNDSVVINDDDEEQFTNENDENYEDAASLAKIKIIQSTLPSKSINADHHPLDDELSNLSMEDGVVQNEDEYFITNFNKSVDSAQFEELIGRAEPKTGLSLLTERIEPPGEEELTPEKHVQDEEEEQEELIRTKDGVILDDQAFLICTPTSANQTPQNEKSTDQVKVTSESFELSRSIVDSVILKSLDIVQNVQDDEQEKQQSSHEQLAESEYVEIPADAVVDHDNVQNETQVTEYLVQEIVDEDLPISERDDKHSHMPDELVEETGRATIDHFLPEQGVTTPLAVDREPHSSEVKSEEQEFYAVESSISKRVSISDEDLVQDDVSLRDEMTIQEELHSEDHDQPKQDEMLEPTEHQIEEIKHEQTSPESSEIIQEAVTSVITDHVDDFSHIEHVPASIYETLQTVKHEETAEIEEPAPVTKSDVQIEQEDIGHRFEQLTCDLLDLGQIEDQPIEKVDDKSIEESKQSPDQITDISELVQTDLPELQQEEFVHVEKLKEQSSDESPVEHQETRLENESITEPDERFEIEHKSEPIIDFEIEKPTQSETFENEKEESIEETSTLIELATDHFDNSDKIDQTVEEIHQQNVPVEVVEEKIDQRDNENAYIEALDQNISQQNVLDVDTEKTYIEEIDTLKEKNEETHQQNAQTETFTQSIDQIEPEIYQDEAIEQKLEPKDQQKVDVEDALEEEKEQPNFQTEIFDQKTAFEAEQQVEDESVVEEQHVESKILDFKPALEDEQVEDECVVEETGQQNVEAEVLELKTDITNEPNEQVDDEIKTHIETVSYVEPEAEITRQGEQESPIEDVKSAETDLTSAGSEQQQPEEPESSTSGEEIASGVIETQISEPETHVETEPIEPSQAHVEETIPVQTTEPIAKFEETHQETSPEDEIRQEKVEMFSYSADKSDENAEVEAQIDEPIVERRKSSLIDDGRPALEEVKMHDTLVITVDEPSDQNDSSTEDKSDKEVEIVQIVEPPESSAPSMNEHESSVIVEVAVAADDVSPPIDTDFIVEEPQENNQDDQNVREIAQVLVKETYDRILESELIEPTSDETDTRQVAESLVSQVLVKSLQVADEENVKFDDDLERQIEQIAQKLAEDEDDTQVKPTVELIKDESVEEENEEEESRDLDQTAKSLVENALAKSIERLSNEPTIPETAFNYSPIDLSVNSPMARSNLDQSPTSSIIKQSTTVGPSALNDQQQQQIKTYSPKEVRFSSNLISKTDLLYQTSVESSTNSTDTPNNTPQMSALEDEVPSTSHSFDLDELDPTTHHRHHHHHHHHHDFDQVTQQPQTNIIDKDQFNDIQNLILTSNYENTFNEMNNPPVVGDDEPAELGLNQEAKSLIENVIEKAIEKVSIIISEEENEDEDEDEDEEDERPKKPADDHEEHKSKPSRKDDDDDDDDDNHQDYRPSSTSRGVHFDVGSSSEDQPPSANDTDQQNQQNQTQESKTITNSDSFLNDLQTIEENFNSTRQMCELLQTSASLLSNLDTNVPDEEESPKSRPPSTVDEVKDKIDQTVESSEKLEEMLTEHLNNIIDVLNEEERKISQSFDNELDMIRSVNSDIGDTDLGIIVSSSPEEKDNEHTPQLLAPDTSAQPLLTSSFMSATGTLPDVDTSHGQSTTTDNTVYLTANESTVHDDEDDEESHSNKTLDLSAANRVDMDSTLSETGATAADVNEAKIKSSSSTSSYFTAVSSLAPVESVKSAASRNQLQRASSVHTSTSSNYMTAVEELSTARNKSTAGSQNNLSTSESFCSAHDDTKTTTSSSNNNNDSMASAYSTASHTHNNNSSLASLNSSYSTLNEPTLSANLSSANQTDTEIEQDTTVTSTTTGQIVSDSSMGQFNVECFLKSMYPLVNPSTSSDEEGPSRHASQVQTAFKPNESVSSQSTLTDDGLKSSVTKPADENEDGFTIISKDDLKDINPDGGGHVMYASTSSLVAKVLLNKKQSPSSTADDLLGAGGSGSSGSGSPLSGSLTEVTRAGVGSNNGAGNNGDNLSYTSSVLEFEKLEAQCNLEEEIEHEQLQQQQQPQIVRMKRPRDNMGMAELNEELVDQYEPSTQYEDDEEDQAASDQAKIGNYDIISHDLNTIYESFERETTSSNEDVDPQQPKNLHDIKDDDYLLVESIEQPNVGEPIKKNSVDCMLLDMSSESKCKKETVSAGASPTGSPSMSKHHSSQRLSQTPDRDVATTSSTTQSTSSLVDNKSSSALAAATLSSRSSSSSSVKSNDSFENELKQKFKIDESSFLARKQREKTRQSSPKSLEVTTTTTSVVAEEGEEVIKGSETTKPDSGQSSMTASLISTSQLQSPATDSGMATNMSNRQVLSNDSLTNSYMSDLSSLANYQVPATGDVVLTRTAEESSGLGGVKKSRRTSRTSSSTSSSSSTSLNDPQSSSRQSTASSVVTVINVTTGNSANKSSAISPSSIFSAEDLPSFRKKSPSSSLPGPISKLSSDGKACPYDVSSPGSLQVTSVSASNSNSNFQPSTTTGSNPSSPKGTRKATTTSPSLSKSHSHHSSDCYCGKVSTSSSAPAASKSSPVDTLAAAGNDLIKIDTTSKDSQSKQQ